MGRREERERLEPKDAREWRSWLEANHALSPGIWLAIGKKGGVRTALTYDEAVEEAVAFGWIDSTTRRLDDDRFLQLFTPRKPTGTWSLSNKRRVERLVADGRMTPAGLAAVEAAKANGSWDTLVEIDAEEIPDDLVAALSAVPGAREGFDGLPSSQRKMTLLWIAMAKRSATREARIARAVAAAAEGRSPV